MEGDELNEKASAGDAAIERRHLREQQAAFAKSMKVVGKGRGNRVAALGGNGAAVGTFRTSGGDISGGDAAFRRLLRRRRGGALEIFLVGIERGRKDEF